MTIENMKHLMSIAKVINRPVSLMNEDSRMIMTLDSSTRTIFDDNKGIITAIRTNRNYTTSADRPFTVAMTEYDSIKMAEIDVDIEELTAFLEEVGDSIENYKKFLSSTGAMYTHTPFNYNKKYKKDENGEYVKDEHGNNVEVTPKMPTIQTSL